MPLDMFIKLALVIIGSATLVAAHPGDLHPVAISFSKSSVNAQEYTEKAAVQIEAIGYFSSPFNVIVVCASTGSRPATPRDDFNASPITVRFTPTKKVQTVNIPVVDDDDCEERETFTCNVTTSSLPAFASARGKVTVSIIDNSKREDDCRVTTGGITYVRWGNSSCPDVDGTSRVYEGRAASGRYNDNGGPSDYVCLISQGKYHPNSTTTNRGWAYMYGTEYEIADNQALTSDRDDDNVPCAVCYATRSAQIMIPGTYECPSGWTIEYFGWLMTGYNGYASSTFVCVDFNAEVVPGEAANNDGALLYHVQTACSYGIQCPPYDQRREVSCVVCTK